MSSRRARQHMASQVRYAATTQAALSRLWDEVIDPADFARTFLVFRERAIPLLELGANVSVREADAYFAALLQAEDLIPSLQPPVSSLEARYVRQRLAVGTQSETVAARLARGENVATVMAAAQSRMLGEAKRIQLQAGRRRLIERSRTDRNVDRWARVSDGKPCSFCAMLVGRGPVYSAATVGFEAHARCGCSVRPVTRGEADGGWTPEARYYRGIFDEAAQGDPLGFRLIIEDRIPTVTVDPSASPEERTRQENLAAYYDRLRDRMAGYAATSPYRAAAVRAEATAAAAVARAESRGQQAA